jgi:hypothetical protein
LTAELLAEEAVVVVAAIKTDVVEDSALAREIDLIAVGPCVMLTLGVSVSRSSNFLPRIGVCLLLFVQCRAGFSLDRIHR